VEIVNHTGLTLSKFTVSYVGEQWRDGGNNQVEQLSFDYALGALSLASGDYVGVSDLDFLSPIHTSTATALDGNQPANRTSLSAQVSGIEWLPGESLWLRWTDVDDPGTKFNSALAVDDLAFAGGSVSSDDRLLTQAAAVPEPNSAALAALSMLTLGVFFRRASKQRS
jgi:hypothetical protein